jgi:8-oxo-dGTP pyrophosphatase MutT (NUDIX family)
LYYEGGDATPAEVASVLGLDPAELEPEEVEDGESLLGGEPGGVPTLLQSVAEEVAWRWKAASAGQFSPTTSRRAARWGGPVTQHVYLEKRLRKVDADGYAAAGLLPFLTLDDRDAAEGALLAALAQPGGQERVLELLTPARPLTGGGPQLPPQLLPLPGGGHGGTAPERRRPPLDCVHVLLARQGPSKKNRGLASSLSFLGGKRERSDSGPLATALREAREETSGLLGTKRLQSELLGPVLWFPQGRFALFLYSMPRSAHKRLQAPSFIARAGGADLPRASKKVDGEEVVELQWLAIADVLAISRAKKWGVARFTRAVVTTPQLFRYFMALTKAEAEERQGKPQGLAPQAAHAVLEERVRAGTPVGPSQ